MSIDVLQDKIRKRKNPSMISLELPAGQLPPCILAQTQNKAEAYGSFSCALLEGLKDVVAAPMDSDTTNFVIVHIGASFLTFSLSLFPPFEKSFDALIESFRKCYVGHVGMENSDNLMTFKSICRIINEQPTAYDVEKVVAQIRNQPFGNYGVQEENEIIDIVKRGGIE